jgi:tyrosine-protein kinase Etk/Wzc
VLREEASAPEVVMRSVVSPRDAGGHTNGPGPAAQTGHRYVRSGSVDCLFHGERIENPLPLLFSLNMTSVLMWASDAYDVVLLDTPPVLAVAEGVPLLEAVDSVLLVARLGHTTQQTAERFRNLIERLSDVAFFGVIANDMRERHDAEGYGSYGRYSYDYFDKKREFGRKVRTKG